MSMPSFQPQKKLFRNGNAPGIIEFGSLLNQLPGAALLYEKGSDEISLANSSAIQLTAFAQDEITRKPIHFLFPTLKTAEMNPGFEKTIVLNRRQRESIPVNVKMTVLDAAGQWLLVLIYPLKNQNQEGEKFNDHVLAMLKQLDLILGNEESITALPKALSIIKQMIDIEFLCLYKAKTDQPELEKIASVEEEIVFPTILPSTDLIRLSGVVNWMPGKKVVTEVHRSARIKDLACVLSCTLGKEGSKNGLVIAATRRSAFNPTQALLIEIAALVISEYIEHDILVDALKRENSQKQLTSIIWKGIFDNARQGILILSPDYKITYINPSAEVMLGYVDWEAQNQFIENILIGSDQLLTALESASDGIPSPDIGTNQLHRRDGSSFPSQIQVIPIAAEKVLIAILIFINDISEHEQIRVQSQQLEHRALLGEVMGVFAHEVRNPINNISTGLQLLTSRLQQSDPNFDLIGRMLGDCTRLNDLMESVLTFSRPLEPKLRSLELDVLIKRIIDRWYPRFTKVNVKPYFQVSEDLPHIAGDPRTLEQVFTNLISNATDAMSATGGNLSIRIMPYNEVPNLPQVEVTVTDNGPGIPDELKDRIFEPFVTNKSKGTGLGLAIVKQIVTAHHGSVQLSTFPGGTVFHVYLPVFNGE
jgi:two-component system, NtrC family, sensor histidine kinase AtoS